MKTYHDCIPCFVRQSLDVARMVMDDERVRERFLRKMLRNISEIDLGLPPPLMGREIHRCIREITGDSDPYRGVKKEYNLLALGMYDDLKQKVEASEDPFAAAVRLAVAGNIIDFGVTAGLDRSQVVRDLDGALSSPLSGDLERLEKGVSTARRILYLGDNAGEILFDRILVEQMPLERVVFAVRGSPVINDATIEDAEAVGLTDIVEVIDNGTDIPGTFLPECSGRFLEEFERADLVISKGQGNYETLSGSSMEGKVAFLFKVKCGVVARDTGRSEGAALALFGG